MVSREGQEVVHAAVQAGQAGSDRCSLDSDRCSLGSDKCSLDSDRCSPGSPDSDKCLDSVDCSDSDEYCLNSVNV